MARSAYLLILAAPSVLAVPAVLAAQTAEPGPPAEHGCRETLAWVVDQIERNYPGFADQVTDATRSDYEALREEARRLAAPLEADARCHEVLRDYLEFFRDRHLRISYSARAAGRTDGAAGPTDDDVRRRFADWPKRSVSEAEARAYLDARRGRLDPVEGIWETVGSAYRVAILPAEEDESGERYEAVVLRADGVWWTPGQIKARLERTGEGRYASTYYMGDHSPRESEARLREGVLVLEDPGTKLARLHPDNPSGYDRERYEAPDDEFAVVRLDDATLLVRLPDFGYEHASVIDSLVEAHREALTSSPNLIVDLRGNSGGATASYRPLRPLFYTGPVVLPGMSMYATEENIGVWASLLERPDLPERLRSEVEEPLRRMREHAGGFAPEPDDTVRLGPALPRPERVIMLTDRFCVSACEALVLEGLQSDKVTTVGTNTGGFLDYGNAVPRHPPAPGFRLHLPIARSNRLPETSYDYVGIDPEIRLPDHVIDPVAWVRERLRTRTGPEAWP